MASASSSAEGFGPPIDALDAAVIAIATLYQGELEHEERLERIFTIEVGPAAAPAPLYAPVEHV